jgi:hypothetical protein
MCSLYSVTRNQEAMRRLFRAKRDLKGNIPRLPADFPDVIAPIVHTAPDGERVKFRCSGSPRGSACGGPGGLFDRSPCFASLLRPLDMVSHRMIAVEPAL